MFRFRLSIGYQMELVMQLQMAAISVIHQAL